MPVRVSKIAMAVVCTNVTSTARSPKPVVLVDTMSASPRESGLVQQLFDFMLTDQVPERIFGHKAYDSDSA